MKEHMQIAETILNQINNTRAYDGKSGKFCRMCWGAEKFGALDKHPVSKNEKYRAGLEFKVNGFKYAGRVRVMLHWSDYYDIELVDARDGEVACVEMIYFPELTEWLDHLIEQDSPIFAQAV